MRKISGALAVIVAVLAAPAAWAQDAAPGLESAPTAEEMIEAARQAYRPPGLRRRCAPGKPGEIVVCAPDPNAYRVESPTDEAIRTGQSVDDGAPRAPDVNGLRPDSVTVARGCFIPPCPKPMPPMIDYDKMPRPLTPEEAAMVFRAEDTPPPQP